MESCFQMLIQFIAVFEFDGIAQDIYLYVSIIISISVILSKFVLISYNPHRRIIAFNMYCYFLDIIFSFISTLFMASILFDNVFSVTGIYIVTELIVFIPLYCYYIPCIFDKSYLSIPILLFLAYPMAIVSFAGFSVVPAVIYCKTHPNHMGKKQEFYQTLFQHCQKSKTSQEFNTKLIILNYICIETYKMKLHKETEYYEFAKWLSSFEEPEQQLVTFNIEEFRKITSSLPINHRTLLPGAYFISLLLNVKIFQVLLRSISIILSLCLDLFYFDAFISPKYSNAIFVFGIVGLILFFLWCLWAYLELYHSKWNYFCANMIASKHPKFVLTQSTESIIKQCDELYQNKTSHQKHGNHQLSAINFAGQNLNPKKKHSKLYSYLSVLTILHIAIIGITLTKHKQCSQSYFYILLLLLESSAVFASIILAIYEMTIRRKYSKILYDCKALILSIMFASYISGALVGTFGLSNCVNQNVWISTFIVQAVGTLICITFSFDLKTVFMACFSKRTRVLLTVAYIIGIMLLTGAIVVFFVFPGGTTTTTVYYGETTDIPMKNITASNNTYGTISNEQLQCERTIIPTVYPTYDPFADTTNNPAVKLTPFPNTNTTITRKFFMVINTTFDELNQSNSCIWALQIIENIIQSNNSHIMNDVKANIVIIRRGSVIIDYILEAHSINSINIAMESIKYTNNTYGILSNTQLKCDYYDFNDPLNTYVFDSYKNNQKLATTDDVMDLFDCSLPNCYLLPCYTSKSKTLCTELSANPMSFPIIQHKEITQLILLCHHCISAQVIILEDIAFEIHCDNDKEDKGCSNMSINLIGDTFNGKIICYQPFSCDNLLLDATDVQQLDLTIEMYEYSGNITVLYPNYNAFNNVNLICNNPTYPHFIEVNNANRYQTKLDLFELSRATYNGSFLPCEGIMFDSTVLNCKVTHNYFFEYNLTNDLPINDVESCYWYDISKLFSPNIVCTPNEGIFNVTNERIFNVTNETTQIFLIWVCAGIVGWFVWIYVIFEWIQRKLRDYKAMDISNPMVIYLAIGDYQNNPSNPEVEGYCENLQGIQKDIFNLRGLFKELLKYQCYTLYYQDDPEYPKIELEKKEIIDFLKHKAKILAYNVEAGKCDGLIVCLSGQGYEGNLITSDMGLIDKNSIHRMFSKYEGSREIPRVILYECCGRFYILSDIFKYAILSVEYI